MQQRGRKESVRRAAGIIDPLHHHQRCLFASEGYFALVLLRAPGPARVLRRVSYAGLLPWLASGRLGPPVHIAQQDYPRYWRSDDLGGVFEGAGTRKRWWRADARLGNKRESRRRRHRSHDVLQVDAFAEAVNSGRHVRAERVRWHGRLTCVDSAGPPDRHRHLLVDLRVRTWCA